MVNVVYYNILDINDTQNVKIITDLVLHKNVGNINILSKTMNKH